MTGTSDKVRAVILAALMVVSVFGGTMALTGMAAADVSSISNASATNAQAEDSSTTQQVTFNVTTNSTDEEVSLNYGSGNVVSAQVASVSNSDVTVDSVSTSATEVTVDVNGTAASQTAEITLDVTHDLSGVAPASGVTITIDDAGSGTDAGSVTANFDIVAQSDETSFSNGGIVFEGQTAAYDVAADDAGDVNDDYTLYQDDGTDSATPERELTRSGDFVNVTTSSLETGETYFISNDGSDPANADIEFTIQAQDFSGGFSADSADNAGSTTVDAEFDSTNRQSTSYDIFVTADDLGDGELVDIFDDGFSVTNADVDGDGDSDGDGIRATIPAGGSAADSANFSGIDAGTYNFTFDVTDTTASDEASIDVNDVGAGDASISNSPEVAEGDTTTITLSLSGATDTGTLVIGNEDDDGYQANVSFTDDDGDGEVDVVFNTYAAGSTSDGTVVAPGDSDDESAILDDQIGISSLLANGDYTLSVSTTDDAASTLDQPDDVGTLFITERSTGEMQLWTAPGAADLDADGNGAVTEGDITTLIEDGAVTQDNTITTGDRVIHQIPATGLEGLVDDEGSVVDAILASDRLDLTIEQTNPRQNRDPKTVNVSASTDAITAVEGDGTYYLVVDTASSDLTVERNGDDVGAAAGDEFDATFAVQDDRVLRSGDSDDHQSVSATFEIASSDTSFDSDPVEVAASEGQAITGSTNFAPGTELTVRVRSDDGVQPRFFERQTVTVSEDGSFSAEFDFFTEQSAGDTFTASVRKSGGDNLADADGEVVDSTTTTEEETDTPTDTETATPTPTETATPTPTETTEAMDTTESMDTTTQGDGPGFGAIVALVALLAAALLAVRRQD